MVRTGKAFCELNKQTEGLMSTVFDDREKGEEARYKLGEEQRFKAHARRNRLLGQWAAELMGKGPALAEAYAKELVALDFDKAGDENVIARLSADFAAAKVEINDATIRDKITTFDALAIQQIANDFPAALDRDHSPVGD